MELLIKAGPSRTHGEPLGERKVTLDLLEETLAESATLPHIPTNDVPNISLFNISYLLINLIKFSLIKKKKIFDI